MFTFRVNSDALLGNQSVENKFGNELVKTYISKQVAYLEMCFHF